MPYKRSTKEQENMVLEYMKEQSVTSICSKHGIPRSTMYSWIRRYQNLKSAIGANSVNITYTDYCNLKRRADKMEEKHLKAGISQIF